MLNLIHIRFRGDFYEIAYNTNTGDIVSVVLYPENGHRGEPISYYDLPNQLQHLIQNELSRIGFTSSCTAEENS